MSLTLLRQFVASSLSSRSQSNRLATLLLSHRSTQRTICSESYADVGTPLDSKWAEHSFLAVANATLEIVAEEVSNHVYAASTPLPNADVDYSQGVLTLAFGEPFGSYVLNTQTPNRQIWLSSPVSGPARYSWHPSAKLWCSTRDKHSLVLLLESELSPILQTSIRFDFSSFHQLDGTQQ